MKPFTLQNDPPKRPKAEFELPEKQRQQVLFAGMGCLPDQQNLFDTDGEEPSEMETLFGPAISVYSRRQAIEDGVLVDGMIGDLAEVTQQHYRVPVAMTSAVFELMRRAVENEKHCNDYRGVWHDVLWMSKQNVTRRFDPTCHLFTVIITGTGRRRNHTLKTQCHPGDAGEPVVTIMLPEED